MIRVFKSISIDDGLGGVTNSYKLLQEITDYENDNVVVKSPHFDNPWKTAFDRGYYNTFWEYVSWEAGGVKYNFS